MVSHLLNLPHNATSAKKASLLSAINGDFNKLMLKKRSNLFHTTILQSAFVSLNQTAFFLNSRVFFKKVKTSQNKNTTNMHSDLLEI